MDRLNYINPANADYINSLYEAYKQDPESIDFGWQKFFEGFDFGQGSAPQMVSTTADSDASAHFLKEIDVLNMINGYRGRGHLFTKTNPVRERRSIFPARSLKPLV